MAVLPESPRWLIKKGRDAEAAMALSRLTGAPPDDQSVVDDLNDVRASLEEERQYVLLVVLIFFGLINSNS